MLQRLNLHDPQLLCPDAVQGTRVHDTILAFQPKLLKFPYNTKLTDKSPDMSIQISTSTYTQCHVTAVFSQNTLDFTFHLRNMKKRYPRPRVRLR